MFFIKEITAPLVSNAKNTNTEPNWVRMAGLIETSFALRFVEKNIGQAKGIWYKYKKQWTSYTAYIVQSMEASNWRNSPGGVAGIVQLNGAAWDIFQHSNKKEELEMAIEWTNRALTMDNSGVVLDTKANLLYKLGRKDEAIELETRAVSREPKAEVLQETLKKMKQGLPTWPQF